MTLILLVHILATLAARVRADCFSHDGIAARDSMYYKGPELVSCGNGTSNCCLAGHKCGTNLLCVDGGGAVSRQYCANAAWNGCSDICPDGLNAGVSLRDCGNNIYCCAGNTEEACCRDERAFYVDPDNGDVVQTTQPAKTKGSRWYTVDTSSILASTTVTSTAGSSTATETPRSSSVASVSTSESAVASSSPSSAAPTASATPPPSSSQLSAGAGAGIGIGGAVFIAMIAAIMWFLFRRRKNKASQAPVSGTYGAMDGAYPNDKPLPQTYYAHNGLAPTPTTLIEIDGGQPERQELDGRADGSTTRHELDSAVGQDNKLGPWLPSLRGRNVSGGESSS